MVNRRGKKQEPKWGNEGDGGADGAATEAPKGKKTNLTDDEERKLLLVHKKTIDEFDKKIATLGADRKNALKRAKSDGISAKDIKKAQYLEKNPDAALEDAKRDHQIAVWLNHPVGSQFSLLDEDRTPGIDKQYEEGKIAGMMGADAKPPSHLTGVHQQSWMSGYHAGQKVNLDRFTELKDGETPPPADAAVDSDDDDRDLRPDHLRAKDDDAMGDAPDAAVRH